ncbi:MAG TPA: lipopolysaccharide biosynthesis protein RfbH [Thermoleophilaceae bacterium]
MAARGANEMREEILELVRRYHEESTRDGGFVPGESPIPVSGRVFDADEMVRLVDAALDFWLTTGRFAKQLERGLARYVGVRHAVLCNSGSSANLLAVSALTSPKLGRRRLREGDEVLTVAAAFPTTVNPLLQNRLVPVFVDVDPATGNVDPAALEAAVGPRTRAVILAHTLGNPFDVEAVKRICAEHGLWLVEDNCDALGSTYDGARTGTFGDLATVSFYPAHQMTTGEGGCVLVRSGRLRRIVESFRDWGRDCWCDPGAENTCGKRFAWQLGDLPAGYDHKYTYSHVGYNLKMTDLQAAVGVAQLEKLPAFVEARRRNWRRLRDGLAAHEDVLLLPEATPRSEPSWFGFAMCVRPGAPFTRSELVSCLEGAGVATRQPFAGNLTRQPAYRDAAYRVSGDLRGADLLMRGGLWIGVYPGLTDEMLDYVVETLEGFLRVRAAA